ncbi:protein FAR1-RELATED SEQUENCE 9-like [Aegilops tauschii subsp. strangulata]|uniref:protein FAR1-RELATED SEQUENCE 9-like n=1 Tax=Aegilops tauschii subsp. strangulata TaxID=200361 RepID=UPI00098A9E35
MLSINASIFLLSASKMLQNVAVEPSIFLDDDMQNVAHEEEDDGIDLNGTMGNDSDDSLQLNTDGVAPNHGNARVASDNANGNAATLVDEPDEEISSQPVVPFLGMVFDNVEEAQHVYNEYASKMGFGTRIVTSKHSRKNSSEQKRILIYRVFECVHSRKNPSKNVGGSISDGAATNQCEHVDMSYSSNKKSASKRAGIYMDVSDKRIRNRLERYDCKARMGVNLKNADFAKGASEILPLSQKDPGCRHAVHHFTDYRNISTANMMGLLGDARCCDPRSLPYVKTDVTNARAKLRRGLSERDLELTIEYFERRQVENPNFFFSKLEEDGAVRALFWVDGRTRALYPKYKDCVFFDTTFCTNLYNLPFAPIVGINNHKHTVCLVCALLPDETIETFKWVFQQWMLAMNNEHPLNQDQAMAKAISMVFPDSTHRCCKWHVFRVARTKLGKMLGKDEPFAEAFYGCINDSDTVEEFEERWKQMVELFGVADKKHLKNMWDSREMWAPVYFRNKFFPFIGTTGRSEGLNSYFKTLNHHGDSVWTFVQQFELCQELMLDREDNAGFINEATRPPLWGNYNIEKQAADFYTREVFSKFQKMLAKSTGYGLQYQLQGDVVWFRIVANYGVNPKVYTVCVAPKDQTYMCTCNMFEMCGLICPHIIRVMVHLNVQTIPATYMLPRWSKRATDLAPEPGDGHRAMHFAVPTTNTLKFNSLCRKFGKLASDACFNDEAYSFVSGLIDQGSVGVAAIKARATDGVAGDEEAQGHAKNAQVSGGPSTGQRDPPPVGLRNPPKSAKKGRPKEKEKRRKPLIEIREDEMKKKAKKDAAKTKKAPKPREKKTPCKYCEDEDHNVKDCQLLAAFLAASASAKAPGVETILTL